MITGGIFLAGHGFFGGGIGAFLNNLENLGFFDYALPFLIIFAIIFGILSKVKLFGDSSKAINGVIAVSVGLMALQFGIVSVFFAELFPRFGVGLSIILVAMVLLGLFIDPDSKLINYLLLSIAAIIVIVILTQSAGGVGGFFSSYWWQDNWFNFVVIALVIGGIIAVFSGTGKHGLSPSKGYTPFYFRNNS